MLNHFVVWMVFEIEMQIQHDNQKIIYVTILRAWKSSGYVTRPTAWQFDS